MSNRKTANSLPLTCEATFGCKRPVSYEVEGPEYIADGRAARVISDMCSVHAIAYDDEGYLRRAVRLTPGYLEARRVARG